MSGQHHHYRLCLLQLFRLLLYRHRHRHTSHLMDHRLHFLFLRHQHLTQLHPYRSQYQKHRPMPSSLHAHYRRRHH